MKENNMEMVIANPIALEFWFTVGCTLAGIAMTVVFGLICIGLKLLVG